MVILIASDDAGSSRSLAEILAGHGPHQIFTAAKLGELEEAAESLEELEVLLFGAAFNKGRGKELRDALRVRFPGLQTALITNEEGKPVPPQEVVDWIAGLNGSAEISDETAGPVILGDYELKEKRRTGTTTETFRAVQRSVNRVVLLERLKPELSQDKSATRAFRSMVRARANVSCPWIATVYEAQESDGVLFYTRELVRGLNLNELVASRAQLQPEESLHLLRAAGEAMTWLAEKNLGRETLKRQHLYQGSDGAPRIANIAAAEAVPADEVSEIQSIAEAVMRVTDFKKGVSREVSHVLGLMKTGGPHALKSWKSVLREARAGLQRMVEARTSLISEGKDRPRARRRKSRAPLLLGIVLALTGGGTAVAWFANRGHKPSGPRNLGVQISIPAGEFTYGDSTRLTLPQFWIDSHEVTIGQYAEFLAGNPGTKFDNPKQPKQKTSHEPKDWAAILKAAREGGNWREYPISLNCPVFNVDWWDAYAYAAWKGRRLPSQEEWEKAARGTNGRRWPWGNEADLKRANTGTDYAERPGEGAVDGYTWWCEVDAIPGDVSPFDVIGMEGNVSEWTSSWVPDPELPDETVPVFRGGDFHRPPVPLSTPWLAKSASYTQPYLGFRTASSSPPSAE
ncbi:MAG TPA: SUMF1/EgtB/PvdO family nonheme iron enzyme [Verrucomicrobiales bacterium]|jgi:formylglycine-generating enzyme required for sulfatase activity|nr:SUMF1/EgtB/PvdO family nonheme iron enzyme [Verrucomicrobiales bacterium]